MAYDHLINIICLTDNFKTHQPKNLSKIKEGFNLVLSQKAARKCYTVDNEDSAIVPQCNKISQDNRVYTPVLAV